MPGSRNNRNNRRNPTKVRQRKQQKQQKGLSPWGAAAAPFQGYSPPLLSRGLDHALVARVCPSNALSFQECIACLVTVFILIIITFLVRNLSVAVLNSVDHPRGAVVVADSVTGVGSLLLLLLFVAFGVSLWLWEKAQVRLRAASFVILLWFLCCSCCYCLFSQANNSAPDE